MPDARTRFLFLLILGALGAVGCGPSLRDPASGDRLSPAAAAMVRTQRLPRIVAAAAELVDGRSDRRLYWYHPNEPRSIASITKLMTALIVVQRLPLRRVVVVSPDAAATGGSTMGLLAGERLTVRALLYGMLLPSGNDAAVALADAVAGSIPRFAALMNRTARRLGLRHSHFVTPNGFDTPGQYSCASDVATLARLVLRRPMLARIVDTRRATVATADGSVEFHLRNTNLLLGRYRGAVGVKTGTTNGAGASLVAAAKRSGQTLIAVILGSDEADRFTAGARLLDFGFASYVWPPAWVFRWMMSAPPAAGGVVPAPVPRWEAAWVTVAPHGQASVPAHVPHG